jgi:DNA-binding NtrC family response regulator
MLAHRPKVGRQGNAMTDATVGTKRGHIWADTGPLILIVDEDIAAGTILTRALEAAGYVAVCAASCASARAVISVCPLDLIVTDVFMPGMCGLALIELVRKRGLGIPVVVKADERWRSVFDPRALIARLGAQAMIPAQAAPALALEIIAQTLQRAGRVPIRRALARAA